ncbi:MAG: glycosyltransferase family 4 protein [Candidatus Protistobacter heckmanni]|nr:glycosyltransferase family 4 protein [Candidatus Protistobacter heckmanni]
MRLLVVTQYFWPENFRINELVAELAGRGREIVVLTGKPNYPEGVVFPAFRENPQAYGRYAGATVIRVPMLARGRGKLRLALNYLSYALSATVAGLWRLRSERFDAIFVFEPSPITVALPAIALRARNGWPVALWVLDQWPESLHAVGVTGPRVLLRAVTAMVRFIYARCDLVLGQSRGMGEQIRKYCPPGARIDYFPNWAEAAYEGGAVTPAPEIPRREDCFSVLFAGNVGEAQDFPAVLDAAQRLSGHADIRWLIVGDGRMMPWVREEIARRGLQDIVLLAGRHDGSRMPSFYQHASALLVSLRRDPIFEVTVPGKLQSYLASGIPVLAMLDGEGRRVVEEAGAGLACAAGDAAGLANAVLRMRAMDAAVRRGMGEAGRQYCRKEYDRGTLVSRMERWLGGLAAGPNGRMHGGEA